MWELSGNRSMKELQEEQKVLMKQFMDLKSNWIINTQTSSPRPTRKTRELFGGNQVMQVELQRFMQVLRNKG